MKFDPGFVVAILAIIGTALAIAAIYGQWRVSRNTATTTQYREIAQGWEEKSKLQDMQINDLQDASHQKDRKIAELEGKVQVLQDALTGKASWDILERRISEALQLAADTRAEVHAVHELLSSAHPS